jgi:hypothetical protein
MDGMDGARWLDCMSVSVLGEACVAVLVLSFGPRERRGGLSMSSRSFVLFAVGTLTHSPWALLVASGEPSLE